MKIYVGMGEAVDEPGVVLLPRERRFAILTVGEAFCDPWDGRGGLRSLMREAVCHFLWSPDPSTERPFRTCMLHISGGFLMDTAGYF